ncbi:type II toxin-antitoxin system RelE/ParE family toxin [Longimicrobium sp.]|uniref:type II toxin-antitoxin system RelE/ParE family toxin n=1 Tax=Longimicrobium sp. TaxID=2029185 RepID=UPI003B3BC79E
MDDSVKVLTSPWYMLELRALPRDHQDQIQRKLIAFAAKGWSAAMADQTVKHLQDGIYELRVLAHGPAFRLLFFVVPGRRPRLIVVTTCAAKSLTLKRRLLDAEIRRAKGRRTAWMENDKKDEEGTDER